MNKRKFYLRAGKVIGIFTFACLLFSEESRNWILYREWWFIPKTTFFFFAIFFIDTRSEKILYWWKVITEFKFVGHKIDGIPVKKLLHILESTNWLLYKTFTQNIASDRLLYDKISNNLERAWILIRWAKNSKILNNSFSINQISSILNSTNNSDKLSSALLQVGEGSYKLLDTGLKTTTN